MSFAQYFKKLMGRISFFPLICLSNMGLAFDILETNQYWLLKTQNFLLKVDKYNGDIYDFIDRKQNRDILYGGRIRIEIGFPSSIEEDSAIKFGIVDDKGTEERIDNFSESHLALILCARTSSQRSKYMDMSIETMGKYPFGFPVIKDDKTGAYYGIVWPLWSYNEKVVEAPSFLLVPPLDSPFSPYAEVTLPMIPEGATLNFGFEIRSEAEDNINTHFSIFIKDRKKGWIVLYEEEIRDKRKRNFKISLEKYANKDECTIRFLVKNRNRKNLLQAFFILPEIVWAEGRQHFSIVQFMTSKLVEKYSGRKYNKDWEVFQSSIDIQGNPVKLELKQKIKGTDFYVKRILYPLDKGIREDTTVVSQNGNDREISINYCIRVPLSYSKVFTFDGRGVIPFYGAPGTYPYRTDSTYIPAFTMLDEKNDTGLSLIIPFEIKKPMLDFLLFPEFSGSLVKARIRNLRLPPQEKGEARGGVIYLLHEGDWRPLLGWLFSNYREYFSIRHPWAKKYEGHCWNLGFGCAFFRKKGEEFFETWLKEKTKWGLKWVLGHTWRIPCYGIYIPDSLTVEEIEEANRMVEIARRYGVGVFFYINPVELLIEKAISFENSVARDFNGNPLPAWPHYFLMNPGINPWHDYIMGQFKRIFDIQPNLAGFHFDRADYWYFDFGHDDGVSMVEGRRAYMISFAMEQILEEISAICTRYKKAIVANGPMTIEICRFIDILENEGSFIWLKKLQYLALDKPLVFLQEHQEKNPSMVEKTLKEALISGAYVTTYDELPVYRYYFPLFQYLKGRQWVFSPHVLEVSSGIEANIFKISDNRYVVYIVNPNVNYVKGEDDNLKNDNFVITLNLKGKKIKRVEILKAGENEARPLNYRDEKGKVILSVNLNEPAAALIIKCK